MCVGFRSGSEVVVYVMYFIFEEEEIDVVFLIDVLNVFNVLNRVVVFYNIRVLCLFIVIYVINMYW